MSSDASQESQKTSKTVLPKLLPFHESIIVEIDQMKPQEISAIMRLIMYTYIPENHDKIADAWDARLKVIFAPQFVARFSGLRYSLMAQKEAVEKQRKKDREDNIIEDDLD